MSAYFHKNYLSDIFRKLIFFNKAPFGSFYFFGKDFYEIGKQYSYLPGFIVLKDGRCPCHPKTFFQKIEKSC